MATPETLCECEKTTFDVWYAGGIYKSTRNRAITHCTRKAVVTQIEGKKPLCRQHAKKIGVIS